MITPIIDLHCHSTISDGLFSPTELVKYAHSKGVQVLALTDHDDIDVIPFWSSKPLAEALCSGDWGVYKPVAIDIEEFLDDWLPGMHGDVLLVGVNWDVDLEGMEIEPLDLLEEFEAEFD